MKSAGLTPFHTKYEATVPAARITKADRIHGQVGGFAARRLLTSSATSVSSPVLCSAAAAADGCLASPCAFPVSFCEIGFIRLPSDEIILLGIVPSTPLLCDATCPGRLVAPTPLVGIGD